MIIWSIALLSFLATVGANCGGITPGFVCKKDCCSEDEVNDFVLIKFGESNV